MIMNTWKFCIALVCAFTSFSGLSRAEDNSINWLGDYQEALRQAKETRKPIFVEYRCEA